MGGSPVSELQDGLVAPCHDVQLCLVLNLGLPCQVSRALHKLGDPTHQNHTMLGPAYPQTLALYFQGLGDSEGNFYWKEKLTKLPLLGVARPLLLTKEHGSNSTHELH